jgi:hypothetical protein
MAGNCNVACAEGHLSLAKEGARVDPETLLFVPIPQLDSLPLSQWIGAKRKRLHQFDLTRPRTRSSQPPTSCGWPWSKALQIVCFSLVTLTRLLY